MAEYIEKEAFKRELFKVAITDDLYGMGVASGINIAVEKLNATPAADVVEVVRCKDCIYFQPDFVLTNSGERRPYTKEEKESHFGLVNSSKGINCGSRCERYSYWEENGIPVWFNENDFCSYGKRKEPLQK